MIQDFNFTAIDFETANPFRSSACAVGLVRVEDGRIVDKYEKYIKPDPYVFNPINTRIHGITEEMCMDAPLFQEVWHDISSWIEGQVVVAHNAPFEKSVINSIMCHLGMNAEIVERYLCTLYMSRVAFPDLTTHRLPDVYLRALNKRMNHHNALEDATASAELAIHIAEKWQPRSFKMMSHAMYEQGLSDYEANRRDSQIKIGSLTPDEGYESNNHLKGKSVVFTGKILGYDRIELAQLVLNYGGKVTEGWVKSTNMLVVGGYETHRGAGFISSKYRKAQEALQEGKNVEILSEIEFINLINSYL